MKNIFNAFKKNSKAVGLLNPNVRKVSFQSNGLYLIDLGSIRMPSNVIAKDSVEPFINIPNVEAEIIESFVKIETIIANDTVKRRASLKTTRRIDNAVIESAIKVGYIEIAANAIIATNPLPVLQDDDVVKISKLYARIMILHSLITASVLSNFDFAIDSDESDAFDLYLWEDITSRFLSTRDKIIDQDAYPNVGSDWIDLFMRGVPSMGGELATVMSHYSLIPSPEAFEVTLIYFLSRKGFPMPSAVLQLYTAQYKKDFTSYISRQNWV